MKKIIIIVIILTTIIGVAIYFLGSKYSHGHETVIPNNASIIAIIDAKKLIKDADISPVTLFRMKNKGTGIDFSCPMYFFITQDRELGFVAIVDDPKELESNFSEIMHEFGLTWGVLDYGFACHDGNRLLVMKPGDSCNNEEMQAEMLELMTKSSLSSDIFDKLSEEKAGIKLRASMKVFPDSVKQKIKNKPNLFIGEITTKDIESINFNLIIKPSSKSISCLFSLDSSDKDFSAIIEPYKDSFRRISLETPKFLPPNNLLWMCLNIDGESALKHLMTNKQTRGYLDVLNTFVEASDMLESIDGDCVLSVGDIKTKVPEVACILQINDDCFLNENLKKILSSLLLVYGKYTADNKSMMYIASSEALVKNMLNNCAYVSDRLNNNEDALFFMSLNVEKLLSSVPESNLWLNHTIAKNMDKLDVCLTQEVLECKFVLKSTLNELINKWTE